MSIHRFTLGAQFRWQTITYEVKRLLAGDKLILEDCLSGAMRTEDLTILVRAFFAEELVFLPLSKEPGLPPPSASALRAVQELSDYPAHLVAIARYRLSVLEPLLSLPVHQRTVAVVTARVAEVQARQLAPALAPRVGTISVASIYRWLKAYLTSGGDLRVLIPSTRHCGAKQQPRLVPEIHAVIDAVIRDMYLVPENVTIDDVHREVALRIEELNATRAASERLRRPGRMTVARRIQALDVAETMAVKHGKRHAARALRQYNETPYPEVPLERVEIDHTRSDVIVIDDEDNLPLGRLTLTYCLDVATRYPLGYYLGFEPASYLTVLECLFHAICPKSQVKERYGTEHDWIAYGLPTTLVIDNGKEFIGRDLEDACSALGVQLFQTPVRTPEFKAGVERSFRSLNTMLFHTLPGTTFSNPRQRGAYDSVQQACISLAELDRILTLFIVDLYAERFHTGLEGIPARRWEEATRFGFLPRLPARMEELQILLGRVATRVIHHYGVEFESLRYNSPALISLRTRLKGAPTKVKYHPGDLSRIYVYDPFETGYVEVPALAEAYTHGLSLWKHRIIRRAALAEQQEVDLPALARARRKIQEIVEAGRTRKRQASGPRFARWKHAGKGVPPASSSDGGAPDALDTTPESHPGQTATPLLNVASLLEAPAAGWELDFSRSTIPGAGRANEEGTGNEQ